MIEDEGRAVEEENDDTVDEGKAENSEAERIDS
jgi:hypothetical protein